MERLTRGQHILFTFYLSFEDEFSQQISYNNFSNSDKAEITRLLTSEHFKDIIDDYFMSITPYGEEPNSYDEDGEPIYQNEFSARVIDIDILVDDKGIIVIDVKLELLGYGNVPTNRLIKLARDYPRSAMFIEFTDSEEYERFMYSLESISYATFYTDNNPIKFIDN